MEIDREKPVCVTGATGYVAGWIVKRLLDEGLTVHATVRDPDNAKKLAHLREVEADAPGTLKFFAADLLEPGSFHDAVAGCGVVFHTASPFQMNVEDPQKDLVDPAVQGTRNLLDAANANPSVTRVVLTSSCAAIYGDNADLQQTPRGLFDEEVWNTSSSLEHQAYSYSKTQAERAAWEMADAQSRWRLVVVNPSLVMGPGLKVHGGSESFNIIRQMGDGTMKAGVPDMGFGVVDVRDLAEAHLRAGFVPDAEGRHVISGHDTSFPEMAEQLRPKYGDRYPIPKRTLPKWAVWLFGPMMNDALDRKVISLNVGHPFRADNSKSRAELGMEYRSLSETMNDFFAQLVEHGEVKAA
ncbi:MAG: NAD-dependent epimerase/dehydratase family protein [Nannocystaceae bacterium]|nr:NAD-dependent epimerase/dehydratase family protein [bacterium]